MDQHKTRRVLAQLSVTPEFREFALPELKTVLRRTGIPLSKLFELEIPHDKYPKNDYELTEHYLPRYPFIILNFPDFQLHRKYLCEAAKTCVMVSKLVLLIAQGPTYQELLKNGNQQLLLQQARNWDCLVHCDFSSRNRTITREEQVKKIHHVLGTFDVRGKVHSTAPQKIFDLIEDHKWYEGHHKEQSSNTLQMVYFGLELSNFRDLKNHKFNLKYDLSNRIYLGPTSTDNDLAYLMINQCNISAGSFVLDPFVGTGGLLVPAAHFGAFTFGSDLDIRVLNGYSVGKINKNSKYYSKEKEFELYTPKIMLPFQQYGLREPQILRMDCLHSKFRVGQLFDAIVCDPPYGIRAMSRSLNKQTTISQISKQQQKKGQNLEKEVERPEKQAIQSVKSSVENLSKKGQQKEKQDPTELQKKLWKKQMKKKNKQVRKANMTVQQIEQKQKINKLMTAHKNERWDHAKIEVTSKMDIFKGLFEFVDEYLKPEGYLVFLYPVYENQNFQGTVQELPSHQHFELLDYSINKLAKGNIRILITMRKRAHV